MHKFKASYVNNPSLKGELADKKRLFGEYHRYTVAPVHTRFGAVSWFVWDAHVLDIDGSPAVIRQEESIEEALRGF